VHEEIGESISGENDPVGQLEQEEAVVVAKKNPVLQLIQLFVELKNDPRGQFVHALTLVAPVLTTNVELGHFTQSASPTIAL